jgi:hypothetical protein
MARDKVLSDLLLEFETMPKGLENSPSPSIRDEKQRILWRIASGRPGEAKAGSAEPRGVRLGVLERQITSRQ